MLLTFFIGHGGILEGVYEIELDTQKLSMRGFKGPFPHSKMGISKKIVGAVFEKTRF
jgi:hypothetical protein